MVAVADLRDRRQVAAQSIDWEVEAEIVGWQEPAEYRDEHKLLLWGIMHAARNVRLDRHR
jgi:hypothetical protein